CMAREQIGGGTQRGDPAVVDEERAVDIERSGVVAGDDGGPVNGQRAVHPRHSIAFGRAWSAVSYEPHRRRSMYRVPRALTVLAVFTTATWLTASSIQAQAPAAKKGGVLRVALIGEPPTLDAHATTAVITREIVVNMYEGLFALDAKYQPVPLLAERAETLDGGKRYLVHLRNNVKFHNGKTLGAADVVASPKRWGAPASASPTSTSCSSCRSPTTPRGRPASPRASTSTSSRSSPTSTTGSRPRRASNRSWSSRTAGRRSC